MHDLGLRTLASIEGEMERIASPEGASGVKEYRARLEGSREQFQKTAAALLQWNRATLARAQAALPQAFHRLPRQPIETRPIEAYRAASSPPAFYQPAAADGSRPAVYYVNTLRPETRPLYNEEALCFHETVPGHHLQIALAQELRELPDFRRYTGETAFVEGWALYAERMSDQDLHLYSCSPTARCRSPRWSACCASTRSRSRAKRRLAPRGAQRQRQRRRRARSGELPRLSGPGTRAKVRA